MPPTGSTPVNCQILMTTRKCSRQDHEGLQTPTQILPDTTYFSSGAIPIPALH